MASNLPAMASNLLVMASNLLVMHAEEALDGVGDLCVGSHLHGPLNQKGTLQNTPHLLKNPAPRHG